MTPVMLARLQAASDYVMAQMAQGTEAKAIIAGLVADHRAFYRRGDPNQLRVAGVSASCTTSEDTGLLAYWQRSATVRIAMEASNGKA